MICIFSHCRDFAGCLCKMKGGVLDGKQKAFFFACSAKFGIMIFVKRKMFDDDFDEFGKFALHMFSDYRQIISHLPSINVATVVPLIGMPSW
jgi:hypothetical protein